jgi:hypothetical protein
VFLLVLCPCLGIDIGSQRAMPFILEAWVHTPEAPVPLPASTQPACVSLRYSSEQEVQHAPVVPLGFSEFLTRVRGYNQDQPCKSTIRIDQASAFYNRQYRADLLPSQHKAPAVKIDDPEAEFPAVKSASNMYAYPDQRHRSRRCNSTCSSYPTLGGYNEKGS